MPTSFHAFINAISGRGIRPGLERMRIAVEEMRLRTPEARVILVGGTNGKGSTAKKLESTLRASGARTYLYSSPHLISFEERFRFNGRTIEKNVLERTHQSCLERFPEGKTSAGLLTPFEWMTLVGACAAGNKPLDYWILEVGMGGRLDAVNCFEPNLSIISSIEFDHCLQLGHDLETIAQEKMGILRPGRPAIVGAAAQPWVRWPDALYEGLHFHGDGGVYEGLSLNFELPAEQSLDSSATLALAATEILVEPEAFPKAAEGVLRSQWPGRFQVFREKPLGILDGAHNPAAASWLKEQLAAQYPEERVHLVLAVRADKDVEGIVQALSPMVHQITAVEDRGGFLMPAHELKKRIQSCSTTPVSTTDSNLGDYVTGMQGPVLVTGSLYLCGELLNDLELEASLINLN